MKKLINILFIPIFIFSFSSISLALYANLNHNIPYKEATWDSIEYSGYRPEYVTQEYIKEEVDKLFPEVNYILNYKPIPGPTAGYTYIMLKLVYIDTNLSLEDYTLTLAHELCHLRYFTANERYTNFKMFQTLYESGNEYFKTVALAHADLDFRGLVTYEYSCAGYIEEYLRGK